MSLSLKFDLQATTLPADGDRWVDTVTLNSDLLR